MVAGLVATNSPFNRLSVNAERYSVDF